MKRALIAILILASGTTVFCALRSATMNARQALATQSTAWQTQTQQLARIHYELEQLTENVGEARRLLEAQPAVPALTELDPPFLETIFQFGELSPCNPVKYFFYFSHGD